MEATGNTPKAHAFEDNREQSWSTWASLQLAEQSRSFPARDYFPRESPATSPPFRLFFRARFHRNQPQSADVLRLKHRWAKQPTFVPDSSAQTGQRDAVSSSCAVVEGADATSPASAAMTLGAGATPEGGSFLTGQLELDVTPTFSTASRRQQHGGGGSSVVARAADAGHTTFSPTRDASTQLLWRRQDPTAQHPRSAALYQEHVTSSSRLTLALEKRQLVFGGRDCAPDRSGVWEDYDRQRLGSEGASDRAAGGPAEAQPPPHAVVAAAGDGTPGPERQSGLFGRERVRALAV